MRWQYRSVLVHVDQRLNLGSTFFDLFGLIRETLQFRRRNLGVNTAAHSAGFARLRPKSVGVWLESSILKSDHKTPISDWSTNWISKEDDLHWNRLEFDRKTFLATVRTFYPRIRLKNSNFWPIDRLNIPNKIYSIKSWILLLWHSMSIELCLSPWCKVNINIYLKITRFFWYMKSNIFIRIDFEDH